MFLPFLAHNAHMTQGMRGTEDDKYPFRTQWKRVQQKRVCREGRVWFWGPFFSAFTWPRGHRDRIHRLTKSRIYIIYIISLVCSGIRHPREKLLKERDWFFQLFAWCAGREELEFSGRHIRLPIWLSYTSYAYLEPARVLYYKEKQQLS